jgi:hypothetical protein
MKCQRREGGNSLIVECDTRMRFTFSPRAATSLLIFAFNALVTALERALLLLTTMPAATPASFDTTVLMVSAAARSPVTFAAPSRGRTRAPA